MGSKALIASISQAGNFYKRKRKNIEFIMKKVDLALKKNPDLICLPENFSDVSVNFDSLEEAAETVPGPLTDKFSQIAKKNSCYIICPLKTKRKGKYWNSAVIIDRSGEITGIYDKNQPVTSSSDYTEMENGISPGKDLPVFDLDFGKIGIQICFDIGYPDCWQKLSKKGVKIVFWPSAYNGGFPLQAYANLFQYYVISAVRQDKSRIIDPLGNVLAQTDVNKNIIYKKISLDFMVCHYDFNYSIPDKINELYPSQIKVTSDKEQGKFLLEVIDDEVSLEKVQKEIGFESYSKYLQRHKNAYNKLLKGESPDPQEALHGNRPQYSDF